MPEADRNALLASIHKGTKLKKAVTNDRSAPMVGGSSSGGGGSSSNAKNAGPVAASGAGSAPTMPSGGGPMGLGGLFAGGMPKLRSTGSRVLSSDPPEPRPPTSVPSVPKPPSSLTPAAPPPTKSSNGLSGAPPPPRARPPSNPSPTKEIRQEDCNSPVASRRPPPSPPPPSSGTTSNLMAPVRAGRAPEAAVPSVRPPITSNQKPPLPSSRPPLPSRPPPISLRLQGMSIDDAASADRTHPAPSKARHASMQPGSSTIVPTQKPPPPPPLATTAAPMWHFPPDSAVPKPRKHSGKIPIYPSGRELGCYINEHCDAPNGNVPCATPPSAPRIAPTAARQSAPQLPVAKKKTVDDLKPLIQDRLSRLEGELAQAIAEQDFETCVQLKPRITRAKELLDRAAQGLPVDRDQIESV